MIDKTQMNAVYLRQGAGQESAQGSIRDFLSPEPHFFFQLPVKGVQDAFALVHVPAQADAVLPFQSFIPADASGHVNASSGLMLQDHIRNDLLKGEIGFRFQARHTGQMLFNHFLQRTVFVSVLVRLQDFGIEPFLL